MISSFASLPPTTSGHGGEGDPTFCDANPIATIINGDIRAIYLPLEFGQTPEALR
jgi:hypothetical protein